MRKKTIAIIASVAMIMMLIPNHPAHATHRITYYTVWYDCVISPPCCTYPVGEWTQWCDGSMTGTGWEPGHNCTRTVVTYGDYCDHPGGGGGPGGGCGGPCDP